MLLSCFAGRPGEWLGGAARCSGGDAGRVQAEVDPGSPAAGGRHHQRHHLPRAARVVRTRLQHVVRSSDGDWVSTA